MPYWNITIVAVTIKTTKANTEPSSWSLHLAAVKTSVHVMSLGPCPLTRGWLSAIPAPRWPTFSSTVPPQGTACAASRAVVRRPIQRPRKGPTRNPPMRLITAARWEIFIFTSHVLNRRKVPADTSPLQLRVVQRPLHGIKRCSFWDVAK